MLSMAPKHFGQSLRAAASLAGATANVSASARATVSANASVTRCTVLGVGHSAAASSSDLHSRLHVFCPTASSTSSSVSRPSLPLHRRLSTMAADGHEASDLHASLGKAVQGRRLLVIRHGNTSKAEVDADRELTEKGCLQCAKFREAYSSHFEGVKHMLVSVAKRTRQTADLLAEGRELEQTAVEDLYFGRPWRTEAMRNADIEAGYRPIKDYIERYPGVHDPAGKAMAGALAEELPKLPPGDVVVVTHSGYMSFMTLEVVDAIALCASKSPEWRESARSVVLEANVGEVSGFEVDDTGVKYLPNPEATDFAAATHNDAFVGPASTIPSAKH